MCYEGLGALMLFSVCVGWLEDNSHQNGSAVLSALGT